MSKPTDFQKRVIECLIDEMRFWQSSNDIGSPSHYTSIEHDMFTNLDEYDLGDGPRAQDLDIIAVKIMALLSCIKDLEDM